MPRKYTKTNQYEKEILQWKSEGITNREIARRLESVLKPNTCVQNANVVN